MADEPLNRRNGDKVSQEILTMITIVKTRQEDYIKQIEKCEAQTKTNTEAVGTLKIKMCIVTWAGTALTLTGLSVLGRWIYKQI